MADPVSLPLTPLPRDVDVTIQITRPQTETASDLSLLCFVTPDAPFPPNNGRVRTYMTFDSVLADTGWKSTDTGYWAAKAFFDQTPRPDRFAVGRIFEDGVKAQMIGGIITDFNRLKSISDGSLKIGDIETTGIDLSGVSTLASVADALNTAFDDNGLTASVDYNGLLTVTSEDSETISFAEPIGSGTDVSSLLKLTYETGAQKWDAYTPEDFVSEIRYISLASQAAGQKVYAWALDRKYRDKQEQRDLADWAESQDFKALACLCTNSPTAYNSQDTTNIGFYIGTDGMGYKSSYVVYHDNPQQYPEIAYACPGLAVQYNGLDTVITHAFKDANGITPCELDVTKHDILTARRINMFVRVGNRARTMRYGMQGSPSWWTDSYTGACNFREELQVAVCNVLYRNKKVPYTEKGITLITSAIAGVCAQYVRNGYFADRDYIDNSTETGYGTHPAYNIKPTPIYRATDTERANRICPPIQLEVYEAGAIHHVNISVDLIN